MPPPAHRIAVLQDLSAQPHHASARPHTAGHIRHSHASARNLPSARVAVPGRSPRKTFLQPSREPPALHRPAHPTPDPQTSHDPARQHPTAGVPRDRTGDPAAVGGFALPARRAVAAAVKRR